MTIKNPKLPTLMADPIGRPIPRAASTNPIVAENMLLGNPPSEWDIADAGDGTFKMGDPDIQGFATDISANVGETISFKIKLGTLPIPYHIDIYRLGYYGGAGARKVDTVHPDPSAFSQSQPICKVDQTTGRTTGLVDCGTWAVSASWAEPPGEVKQCGVWFFTKRLFAF